MTFDLRITFTGMCLFVPDGRLASDERMHVLLPATDKHPHDARLMVDRAYMSGASSLERVLECRVLDRQEVRFAGLSGGAVQELPPEIVNLRLMLDKVVTTDKLAHPAPAAVKSRVTLNGGTVTDYEYGAAWDMPYHKGIPMTWQVEWTVRGIETTVLQWQLVSLDTGTVTEDLPPLRPIGGVVHVLVYHVLSDELPGNPPLAVQIPDHGDPAEHFPEFFVLTTGGTSGVPKFSDLLIVDTTCPISNVTETAAHAHHALHARATNADAEARSLVAAGRGGRGGSPFTCMAATAPIGP